MKKYVIGAVGQVRAAITAATPMAERRLAVCKACPMRQLRPDGVCGACGCFMPDKVKLRDKECPLGYWSKEP